MNKKRLNKIRLKLLLYYKRKKALTIHLLVKLPKDLRTIIKIKRNELKLNLPSNKLLNLINFRKSTNNNKIKRRKKLQLARTKKLNSLKPLKTYQEHKE